MTDALDEDRLLRGRERHENSKVADSELELVRANEPFEQPGWVSHGLVEFLDDSRRSGSVEGSEVSDGGIGPEELPGRQSPSRRFTVSCSVSRPARRSSRAFSSPTRNESV